MAFPLVFAAIGGFITMTASRVISVVAGRKLAEKSRPKPVIAPLKKDERSRKAEADYFRAKSEREQELVNIQADLAKMREVEVLANIEIAKAEAEREERTLVISEKNLQLRKQELELAKTRLKQDIKLAEGQRQQAEKALQLRERELELMAEDLNERRKLSYLNLELQREQEANQIALKLTEIQSNWDRENWAGIISREEMQRLLIEAQKQHRLVMMISPPDISDCPEFNTNLQKEVRSEVKEFLEQHYPLNNDTCPVEYYGKFFKTAIFDAEVKQLESDLSPVPTVVIYSDITDHKIYFHVTFWGLENPLSLTLPWHWKAEQQKLIEQGLTSEDSMITIRQSIIKIHQLLAAFLADLYYLNINPLHQPRLLEMETDIPPEWMQTNLGILKEIQQQKLAEYQQELEKPKFEPIQRFVY
ncbi:MAG: hypothetical protein F6K23_16910 [Okeania sp. SIO2C9]|uniref:hypothetical protein n=1 Tax=Okeania sp. SIO2C9 TaxID=2607791 RepID=UPI0013C02A77|nr:hypothetical protein [Okeania sp. SIO2C9]NEQ74568.1 hypothetical protein [Okeania sp. SIO2C9]